MSGEVIFEDSDDSNIVSNISIVPGAPTGMLAWLIKSNVAKNGKQAEQFLLIVTIASAVLAVIIYFLFNITYTRTVYVTAMPGPNGTLVPVSKAK